MNLFECLAAHDYGEVHVKRDASVGLRAIVAIHDTRLGPALGGSRFVTYVSEEAAFVDAIRLARAMTYKAALAGLDHGGGKAVIMRPEVPLDRSGLFRSFGRFVDALGGRYITTEDSGTLLEDMDVVRTVTRHVAGFDKAQGGSGDPSPFTALGVRRGIEACVDVVLGRNALRGVHVVVKGVGNVGANLCRELAQAGARLTVADVDPARTRAMHEAHGAEVVAVGEAHRTPCDVFAPCALGAELDDRTIPELVCAIVAGGANNQLAETRHGELLLQRGIAYAPDYAINAGGLINVAQEVKGYDPQKARERTLRIYETIHTILTRAQVEGCPPHRVADRMVEERLSAAA